MKRDSLGRTIWLELLSEPWTLIPAVLGGTTLFASWGFNMGGGATFAGVVGLLIASGAAATRWLTGSEQLTARAMARLEEDARRTQRAHLDQLHRRLRRDRDPRDERLLADLRALYELYQEESAWRQRIDRHTAVEISGQVERLFHGCVGSLERSVEILEAARDMKTADGKAQLLARRNQLLDEVEHSIQQMGKTLDSMKTMSLAPDGTANLAQIRNELDESLAVARRVEQRMQSLDAELGTDAARRVAEP